MSGLSRNILSTTNPLNTGATIRANSAIQTKSSNLLNRKILNNVSPISLTKDKQITNYPNSTPPSKNKKDSSTTSNGKSKSDEKGEVNGRKNIKSENNTQRLNALLAKDNPKCAGKNFFLHQDQHDRQCIQNTKILKLFRREAFQFVDDIKNKADKSSMTAKEKQQGLQYLREQHSYIQSRSNQQMCYRNPAVTFILPPARRKSTEGVRGESSKEKQEKSKLHEDFDFDRKVQKREKDLIEDAIEGDFKSAEEIILKNERKWRKIFMTSSR